MAHLRPVQSSLGWADLWGNQGQVPKHGTTFSSFIDALNTLASINAEDGAGLSIRLEIQEEAPTEV